MYDINFLADFLATEGTNNGIWPAFEKLLFPSAKEHLSEFAAPIILAHGATASAAHSFANRVSEKLREQDNRSTRVEGVRNNLQLSLAKSENKVKRLKEVLVLVNMV